WLLLTPPPPRPTLFPYTTLFRSELSLLQRLDLDIRDRGATPASWYEPFREATWDEALELTTQELLRIKGARGGDALACFSSAKCSNEENYLLMRLFRGALGTNNIDHC